ncbi:hypothetical protein WICMUC_001312 [Wickerhamomyces mucosus]|uniref:Uncharacterized protein n=1 Tax=Wickerhamomyces mucosus TaxID=1378264 RepID=A0A9P8PXA3_9ASCO|nr:hypothetical protein WICMUC_001312 [Wickerhamomyces mucosus]
MDEQLIELEDSLSEELNKRENDNLTKIHKKNQRTNPTNDIDDDDNNDNSNNDGDDDDLDKVINHEELNNIFKYLKNYKVGDSNDWKQFYYDYFKKLMPSIMEEFDGILKDLIKSFISRFLYEKLTKQYEFSKITNFEINKLLFKVTSNDIKTFFNNVNDRPWNKDWFFWEYLNGLNLNKTEISNYKSELNLNLSLYHKSSIIKQSIIETEFQDQEEEEEEEEITEQNDELEEKDEELEYILFQIETFQTTIIDCYRAELFNIDQYKQFQIPPPQVIDVSYSGFEYLDGLKLSFQTKINLIKELTKLLDIEIDQDLCENIVPEMSMIYNYTFTNNE